MRAFGEAYRTFLTQPQCGVGPGVPRLLSGRRHHDVRHGEAVPAGHRHRHRSPRRAERLQHRRVDPGSDRRRRDHLAQGPGALSDADGVLAEPGDPALLRAGNLQAEIRGHRSGRSRRAVRRWRRANSVLRVPDAALPRRFLGGALRVHHRDRVEGSARSAESSRARSAPGSAGRSSSRSASSPPCPAWCWCSSSRRRRSNWRRRPAEIAMPRRPSFVFAHGAGAPSTSAWMRAWRRAAGHAGRRGGVRLSVHARGAEGARPPARADRRTPRGAGQGAGARQGAGVPDR